MRNGRTYNKEKCIFFCYQFRVSYNQYLVKEMRGLHGKKQRKKTLSINFFYSNVANCAGGRDDIIIVTIVG